MKITPPRRQCKTTPTRILCPRRFSTNGRSVGISRKSSTMASQRRSRECGMAARWNIEKLYTKWFRFNIEFECLSGERRCIDRDVSPNQSLKYLPHPLLTPISVTLHLSRGLLLLLIIAGCTLRPCALSTEGNLSRKWIHRYKLPKWATLKKDNWNFVWIRALELDQLNERFSVHMLPDGMELWIRFIQSRKSLMSFLWSHNRRPIIFLVALIN